MAHILIVEDNIDLAVGLRSNLELEGYEVSIAADGVKGLSKARAATPDLVILDLMLPKLDGYRLLRLLRADGLQMPVLVLTARGDEADKVRGFRWGADDYVTKPFGLMELLARVEALLRRNRSPSEAQRAAAASPVHVGDIEVRPATHEVLRGGSPVVLRPKEFDLLMALIQRNGQVVSRNELLHEVWGYEADIVSRTVDTHMAELRRKLEHDPSNPRHLLTVRKTGYRLQV
ncbi:MAG TPA: response regulator transcription factor [Gemmatimonadaceae bacterium]|nr:response regulator transcription factor [Gemmatimonadaceae bacterium]